MPNKWNRAKVRSAAVWGGFLLAAAACLCAGSPAAQAQKYGGTLKAMLRENWPSLSIHDEATISAVWPLMPLYSNLVLPDPARPTESSDHLIGELAESWTWSKDFRHLTFKLRHGVTFHDGKPFTSNDVKFTFDVVRGASDKRLKLNPRKDWYSNVDTITTSGDYEVTFNLKRPQPGLIALLASGYSPVYPAHVDPQQMRTQEDGTGPFMVKSVEPDEALHLVRNPNYFVKGRPYLDGIDYIVIKAREARTAALIAGQLDIAFPGEGTSQIRDQLMHDAPTIVITKVAQSVNANLLVNTRKPPFDNLKVRQAVNLAMDRNALNKTVYQGVLLLGGANLPNPYSEWGLTQAELSKLPGWGDPEKDKAEARKLLAEAGYGPNNPLKITVSTRAIAIYVDVAIWVIDQLKQVGIEGTLAQFETGVWHPMMSRREFQLATNLTGIGSWDPDANYFENYACGSPRNYTDYCSKEVQAWIDEESQETSTAKRLAIVKRIDRQLQIDAARPMLGHLIDFFAYWPYVKGLVPHNSVYNYGRMQNVWLDK
jgi:peptide/nickel transport system substrate-binding protein